MKRNIFKVMPLLMSAFLLALTSCVKKKQQLPKAEVKQEIKQPEISPLDSVIRHDFKSANEMAFLLFEQVDKHKGRENFMISPFSLTNALVMLANGADGNTLKQIKDVLGAKAMSIDKVCKMYRDLDVYLKSIDTETSFANASSIWIDDKFKVKADFLKKNKEIFNAEVYNRPLATEKTMNDINSWCNRQTNGHIKDVLNNIPSPDSRMLLMNALYFNGKWASAFSKEDTKEEFFKNSDGSKSKVNMMHKFEGMRACVCDKFDIVEFPYGKGESERLNMLLQQCFKTLDCTH
jgi:serpin B